MAARATTAELIRAAATNSNSTSSSVPAPGHHPGNKLINRPTANPRHIGLVNAFDNALAESIKRTLKVELVHRTVYSTGKKAQEDIAALD